MLEAMLKREGWNYDRDMDWVKMKREQVSRGSEREVGWSLDEGEGVEEEELDDWRRHDEEGPIEISSRRYDDYD